MNKKLLWALGIITFSTLVGFSVYKANAETSMNFDFFRNTTLNNNYRNQQNQINDIVTKIDLSELREKVNLYVKNISENLEVADIFIYENTDYYFSIEETDTGKGAMELLVNPYTGEIYPEYGPNMMWNEKYDMMGGNYSGMMDGNYSGMMDGNYSGMMGGNYSGMMGGNYSGMMGGNYSGMMGGNYSGMMDGYYNNNNLEKSNVSREDALVLANRFVQTNIGQNLNVPDKGHEFYGYFTFHIEQEGTIVGMLSVNQYTGDIWYHNWHGNIIEIISHDVETINLKDIS